MRPAVLRGSSGRTRGRTSNHLPTITTPKPTAKPEPEAISNTGVHIRELTPAPWRARAACATKGEPDWWHPTSLRTDAETIREAVTICLECPVKFQCLEWALENEIPDGIYGGVDEWRRQLMLQRRT